MQAIYEHLKTILETDIHFICQVFIEKDNYYCCIGKSFIFLIDNAFDKNIG